MPRADSCRFDYQAMHTSLETLGLNMKCKSDGGDNIPYSFVHGVGIGAMMQKYTVDGKEYTVSQYSVPGKGKD